MKTINGKLFDSTGKTVRTVEVSVNQIEDKAFLFIESPGGRTVRILVPVEGLKSLLEGLK